LYDLYRVVNAISMIGITGITGITGNTSIVVDQKNRVEYTLYKKIINVFELLHENLILSSKKHL